MTEGGAPTELLGLFSDHAVWQEKASTAEWFVRRGLPIHPATNLADPIHRRDAAMRAWAHHTECSKEQLRQIGIRARTPARERARYLAAVLQ